MPLLLDPKLQELGSHDADRGLDPEDLKTWLKETEKEGEKKVRFDWDKIDASGVEEGWNSKVSSASHVVCDATTKVSRLRQNTEKC